MNKPFIFPSLISARLLNLQEDIEQLEPYVAGFHIDVMDMHYVPNLTFGFDLIAQIREATTKPLSIHLMVEKPEEYIKRIPLESGDIVSIHADAPSTYSTEQLFQLIKDKGAVPSLTLNPEQMMAEESIYKLNPAHILLMGVQPGFSGQKLLPSTFERVEHVSIIRRNTGLSYKIMVDGGVDENNSQELLKRGTDQLVIGSALFKNQQPLKNIRMFQ